MGPSSEVPGPLGPEHAPRRLVWCATEADVVHGRTREGRGEPAGLWQRLLGIQPRVGTVRQFEAIELEQAQSALERFLSAPGSFAIETAEGARLDLEAPAGQALLTLDCRTLDCPQPFGVVVVRRGDVPRLLECVYHFEQDEEVARVVLELAARAIRTAA